ncbi:hypothetical protein AAG906_012092 [Vitis piasezkii]
MMWSSTLTTSSTISLPLRLRSTFQQLLNVVARATWYDGSHGYKDFKRKMVPNSSAVFSSETPSKKGDQSLEIKFLKPTTMAGAPYQPLSAACSVITNAIQRRSRRPLSAAAPFQASFRRHLIQMGSATRCRSGRRAPSRCGAAGVDAEHAGRGVHGAVRVGAVHADGVKIGFWRFQLQVPKLRGDNFKIWKERILLQLGCMDKDYAIRKYEPHKITDTSTPEEILLYKRWEKSNRLSMIILIMKFTSLKLTGIRGVCEHIMEMRDIVAQLKKLEVEMSESFLVHFILNTLPPQYGPFKISYNTHKDKWSINELMTMCVQEEGRLLMEQRESAMLVTQRKGKKGKSQASKKGKQQIPPKSDIKKDKKCFSVKRKDT